MRIPVSWYKHTLCNSFVLSQSKANLLSCFVLKAKHKKHIQRERAVRYILNGEKWPSFFAYISSLRGQKQQRRFKTLILPQEKKEKRDVTTISLDSGKKTFTPETSSLKDGITSRIILWQKLCQLTFQGHQLWKWFLWLVERADSKSSGKSPSNYIRLESWPRGWLVKGTQ